MRLLLISITLATLIGCSSVRVPLVHTTYDVDDWTQKPANDQSALAGKSSNAAANTGRRGEPVDRDENNLSGIIKIPLKKDKGGNFYVEGTLNGVLKVKFHLDTGASTVLITKRNYSKLLKKGGVGATEWYSQRSESSSTATGESVDTTNFLLSSLDVGAVHMEMVRTTVLEEKGGSNLLGLSFLNRLGEYAVDVENSVLVVRPSDVYRPVPRLAYFASSDQHWMQAMQHWETAAEAEATKIADKLRIDTTPLYLVTQDSEGSDNSFISAYTKFLAQHLLSKGKTLITDPRVAEINDAPELRSNVVVTRHNATEEEVMVTTTIHHGGQMIFSNSTVYYLNPPDAENYKAKNKAKKKNLSVVGS